MRRALNPGLGLAILRVVVGVTFMTHGVPKLTGAVGETAGFFATLGIPAPTLAAWGITLLETFGGLLLVVGFLVTPVAVLFCIHMLMGIILVHSANGWYVIGFGQGGAELNVLLIAACLALIFAGPGSAAIDARKTHEVVAA
ncbi:MAG: DoxX family protein [Gemmatimonadota bacterium]